MSQPIPKKIKENNPDIGVKPYNTLLVDASNLLQVCVSADKTLNSEGVEIGGVFQFLLQLKIMLKKGNFKHVYCFFDSSSRSGELRYQLNREYKANRDKEFEDEGLSDYMKTFNARVRSMETYFKNKNKHRSENDKENFFRQRDIVLEMCEELFVRTVMCDITEADDFIGYYVGHREPNERIVILSNDRDLTQLISENVIIYVQSMHDFLTGKNHTEKIGYHHANVLLKKIICGDTSDNIKGIKGVGEKTLIENFPQMKERPVTLDEIIEGARKLNEGRIQSKKKTLKWAENIVNKVTDGIQGEKIYEINEKIIDLSNPLMTDEAKELMDELMHAPMDPEGRSMENLYALIRKYGIDELTDDRKFSSFFIDFQPLVDNEKKFYNNGQNLV